MGVVNLVTNAVASCRISKNCLCSVSKDRLHQIIFFRGFEDQQRPKVDAYHKQLEMDYHIITILMDFHKL